MDPKSKIKVLVTGATGNVGSQVVKYLSHKYGDMVEIWVATKNIEKAKQSLTYPNLSFVEFDFAKIETMETALSGKDKLFLLRPPELSNVHKYFSPLIQICQNTHLKHIIFLSLQGAQNNTLTPHHKIEQLILKSGLNYTFLRPSFFMQNLTTTHKEEIKNRNEIFIPAGDGKTNFVDAKDIGEVAALNLSSDNYLNQAFELTGREAFDYYQIAEIISRVTSKQVIYKDPSVLAFFICKLQDKVPLSFILVMIALYSVARFGKAAGYSRDLENLLLGPPTSFEEFATRSREEWL